MTKYDLLPCPFCGGAATYERSAGRSRNWYVWCDACSTRGDYYNTKAEAAAAWNRRVPLSTHDLTGGANDAD